MKNVTGRVLPAHAIVHCGPDMHIFNGSDHAVYVEIVDETGELRVKPPKNGGMTLVVKFGLEH